MQKYNINIDQRELWTILKALGRLNEPQSIDLMENIKSQYSDQRINQKLPSENNEIKENGNKNK